MLRAHKIRLNPTGEQETYFAKSCGIARFTYNWALEHWKKHKKEHPGEVYGPMALNKKFNSVKRELFPWTYEVGKSAVDTGFRNLAVAMKNYYDYKNGKRKGEKVGFPKFKSKKSARQSFCLDSARFSVDGNWVKIARLDGKVNMAESLRYEGEIRRGVVSKGSDGRWYISVLVRMPDAAEEIKSGVVGIDVGIKTLATLSDGTRFENQELLRGQLNELKRLNRRLSRRQKDSKRWGKAKLQLGRFHARIANRRADHIHKMTTKIAGNYGTVVLEDLNVAGMKKNHHLALSLSDAAFGEIKRQLKYKCDRVVFVDRFFPSSKLCSVCGAINDGLTLADRVFVCPSCGHSEERDFHAAKNILAQGLRILDSPVVAASDSKGRGRDVRPHLEAIPVEAIISLLHNQALGKQQDLRFQIVEATAK